MWHFAFNVSKLECPSKFENPPENQRKQDIGTSKLLSPFYLFSPIECPELFVLTYRSQRKKDIHILMPKGYSNMPKGYSNERSFERQCPFFFFL